MIGTKTFGTLGLVAATVLTAFGLGALGPEVLVRLEARTVFWVAFFAVLAGTMVYRFWRVDRPSAHYLRLASGGEPWDGESHFLGSARWRVLLGDNTGEAFDLAPGVHHALYVGAAFLLGLGTLEPRALEVLASLSEHVSRPSGQFCPEAEEAPATPEQEAPGCALVKRAFELGYAKSLGECAPKKAEGPKALCHLRQRDEPLLHYTYRLLEGVYRSGRSALEPQAMRAARAELEHKLAHVETLLAAQRQVMTVAPRSSHHLFTNLPEPDREPFAEHRCLERFRVLPHRPAPGEPELMPSRVLEHVLAKLLFETRYVQAVAFCPELTVHWGAPADACERLARAPSELLTAHGAAEHVAAALGRKQLAGALAAVAGGSGGPVHDTLRPLAPQQFISFACFMEVDGAPLAARVQRRELELFGERFSARELIVPPVSPDGHGLYVERYRQLAELLADGFHYGALLSAAGLEPRNDGEAVAKALAAPDFALARLDALRAADIFVSSRAMPRPELLEVYPYHQHLGNFVRVFRQHYVRQRGRL